MVRLIGITPQPCNSCYMFVPQMYLCVNFNRRATMRPNSQGLKHKSSHDTEREFGGTLGELQQSCDALLYITVHPLSFYVRCCALYVTKNYTLNSRKCRNSY